MRNKGGSIAAPCAPPYSPSRTFFVNFLLQGRPPECHEDHYEGCDHAQHDSCDTGAVHRRQVAGDVDLEQAEQGRCVAVG